MFLTVLEGFLFTRNSFKFLPHLESKMGQFEVIVKSLARFNTHSLLAEALFLVFADGRKKTSAMDRKWLRFNRSPQSWTAVLQRMLLVVLADRNLSPMLNVVIFDP